MTGHHKIIDKKTGLFLVIPIMLAVTAYFYIRSTGYFFLHCVDPEYGYLLSGLLLANLRPEIQFITNPGVPLHYLVAIVIHIIHLFRPGQPLVDDVLTHPELYIKGVLYSINILNAGVVFYLGVAAYKYTRTMIVSLFLQLLPYTNLLTLESLSRMMPEALMIIIISFWLIVLLKMLYQSPPPVYYIKYCLVFGLLFATGLADKLTFLPFLAIPLIMLPDWKNRLYFIVFSIVFFLIIAFPVTLKYRFFITWVTDIISHTGSYGGGNPGLVIWNEFADHFMLHLKNTPFLVISTILLIVAVFLHAVFTKQPSQEDRLRVKISVSLIVTVFLAYIIASKHFAYHYMNPAILLTVFIIVLFFELFRSKISRKILNTCYVVTALLLIINIVPKMNLQLAQMEKVTTTKTNAWKHFKPALDTGPNIICPSYYGCSSVEYALTYGLQVNNARDAKFLYERIKELYPQNDMYFSWGKIFFEGIRVVYPSEFLKPEGDYFLYIADYSKTRLKEVMTSLQPDSRNLRLYIEPVYYSPPTAEALFVLKTVAMEHKE